MISKHIIRGGKIMKIEVKEFKNSIQPSPYLVVSCHNEEGEYNALAVAYACNCSFDPPMVMVGIVPSRYSYNMVKETGEFVVNLASEELEEELNYLGSNSGRDEDKLEQLELDYIEGEEISAPILNDFPVNIECKVIDSIKTGSHEMFVGKIEYIHCDEELVSEDGKIDFDKINLLYGRK